MAIPPAFSGKPPFGNSPASTVSGNPGLAANALAQVREAVNILQMALPHLPQGSEPWKEVYGAIGKLGKIAPEGAGSPGIQQTTGQDIMAQQKQQAPLIALMRSMANGGQQPGALPQPAQPAAE